MKCDTCTAAKTLAKCEECERGGYSAYERGATGLPKAESTIDSRVSMHTQICKTLTDIYQRKNSDYGDSFHKTFLEEGYAMSRIRLSDKLERFKALTKGADQQVQDESVTDTLIDLANYAIMTVIEMRRAR